MDRVTICGTRLALPLAAALLAGSGATARADDYETMIVRGSVQLGGELVLRLADGEKTLPDGARCRLDLPPPYDDHVEVISDDCRDIELGQATVPIRDAQGYALPSAQVPYTITVMTADGSEAGDVSGTYPYNNQFSDLRILIKDVRNPVSEGQSFEAEVQGAGQPIHESLLCRWNLYGPVSFEPASENRCTGQLTVGAPTGRDADMDVEIVNLVDMHAVGYATASMIVE